MPRTIVTFALLIGVSLLSMAQTPEFDRLPVWPSDGKVPKWLQDKYVFRDVATMEIVISYPSHPGDPAGPRTTYRYRPQNQVAAQVSVAISGPSDGRLVYSYTIRNGLTAKQSIEVWSLVGPESTTPLLVDHPQWAKTQLRNSKHKQAALPEAAPGDLVYFSSHSRDGLAIGPGAETSGFSITSICAPGFTTAYAQGGTPLSTNGELPEVVGDQLMPFMKWEQTNQVILTLGPRYAPGSPKRTIAEEYLSGLNLMITHGQLMPGSVFARALVSALEGCRQADANRCDATSVDSAAASAEGAVEKQIGAAVILALGSRAAK